MRFRLVLWSLFTACVPAAAAIWFASAPAAAADAEPKPPAEPPAAATRPAAVFTYHVLYRQSLKFNRQTLPEAYKAVGKHDPDWDRDAIEYLDLLALQATGRDLPPFYRPPEDKAARERIAKLGE